MKNNEQSKKSKKYKVIIWIAVIALLLAVGAAVAIKKGLLFGEEENNESSHRQEGDEIPTSLDKPIIYLYPTQPTDIQVKLLNHSALTHTYPKYKNSWNVSAQPNGDLVDKNTNRQLYSLYWEGKHEAVNKVKQDGFVIKGSDTIPFLEEKLEQLGLSEHEAQEFIIYWLPKLESSPYNYIRFQTQTEITKNMPLQITPKPDNLVRVMMEFKNLDQPLNNITEQQLTKPDRQGYTVVEWGGTEIN